jgi:hypothetical protein
MNVRILMRRFPVATAALLLAVTVSIAFTFAFPFGHPNWIPRVLKPLFFAGLTLAYALAFITNSLAVILVTFWVSMLVVYAIVGFAIDIAIIGILRWRSRLHT